MGLQGAVCRGWFEWMRGRGEVQPFDFFTRYCCVLVFWAFYILMFASLASGSLLFGAAFGFSAVWVMAVQDDLVRWMVEK